jgi:hypothetical protein
MILIAPGGEPALRYEYDLFELAREIPYKLRRFDVLRKIEVGAPRLGTSGRPSLVEIEGQCIDYCVVRVHEGCEILTRAGFRLALHCQLELVRSRRRRLPASS